MRSPTTIATRSLFFEDMQAVYSDNKAAVAGLSLKIISTTRQEPPDAVAVRELQALLGNRYKLAHSHLPQQTAITAQLLNSFANHSTSFH